MIIIYFLLSLLAIGLTIHCLIKYITHQNNIENNNIQNNIQNNIENNNH